MRIRTALIASVLVVGAVAAQEARVEHQAPLIPEGNVLEIPAGLRQRLQVWPEVQGFESARLFQGEDSTWVLEIAYRRAARLSHERRPLSADAVRMLRQDLAARRARPPTGAGLDQAARGGLVFDQMLLSLLFHGQAVPTVLGLDGVRPVLACYMMTNAAGFYLPYRLTRKVDVTPTHRQMTRFGAWGGIVTGALVSDLVLGDAGGKRTMLAGMVAGSALSAWAGYRAVGWRGYNPGQGLLCEVMAQLGTAAGVGTALASGLYEDDGTRRGGHALVLAGGGLGLWGGDRLGRRESYTEGDAHVLRAGGLLGAVAALPLVNATRTESGRVHAGGAAVGVGAGTVITNRLLRGQSFTPGQGIIITCGELAGGLLGLGLTYLADTGGHFDELAYLSSLAVGSATGFTLTFRVLSR